MVGKSMHSMQCTIAAAYIRLLKRWWGRGRGDNVLTLEGYSYMVRRDREGLARSVNKAYIRLLAYLVGAKPLCDRSKELGFDRVISAAVVTSKLEVFFTNIFLQRTQRLEEYAFLHGQAVRDSRDGTGRCSLQPNLTTPTGISTLFTDVMGCLLLKSAEGRWGEGAYVCDIWHLDSYERRPLTVSPGCVVVFDARMELIMEECRFADPAVSAGDERLKCLLIASSVLLYATLAKHLGMVHIETDNFAFALHKNGRMTELQANLTTGLAYVNDMVSFLLLDAVLIFSPFTKKGIMDLLAANQTEFEQEFNLDAHVEHNNVSGLDKVSPLFRSLRAWWLSIKERVEDPATRCLCFANVVHELYSNETLTEIVTEPAGCVFTTLHRDTLKPTLACSFQLLKTLISTAGSHGRLCDLLGIEEKVILDRMCQNGLGSGVMTILHPDRVEYSIAW